MKIPLFLGLCLFGILSFEYTYIDYLRHHEPLGFYNGHTNFLAPWFLQEEDTYAAKVKEIRKTGIPWDPDVREDRSKITALMDSLSFYLIYVISFPFKNLAFGWVWTSYIFLVVEFEFLYLFFKEVFPQRSEWAMGAVAFAYLCLQRGFQSLVLYKPGVILEYFINFGFAFHRPFVLRMDAPLIPMIFFFGWLLCVFKGFSRWITYPMVLAAPVLIHSFIWFTHAEAITALPFQLNMYISYLVGFLLACWVLHKWKGSDEVARTILIASFLLAFFNVKSFCEKNYALAGLPVSWEGALNYLNAHTQKDDKLLTISSEVSQIVPVMTSLSLQVADSMPLNTSLTHRQNWQRMEILLKTLQVDRQRFIAERYHRGWEHHFVSPLPVDLPLTRLKGLYYVWLNEEDRSLVWRIPRDWTLVYTSKDVALYRHGH